MKHNPRPEPMTNMLLLMTSAWFPTSETVDVLISTVLAWLPETTFVHTLGSKALWAAK